MTDTQALELVSGALLVATKLAGPLLIGSLVIGVVISIFQTITQIQEATISFVPKLVGMAVTIVVGGHWMLNELIGWCRELWTSIPSMLS